MWDCSKIWEDWLVFPYITGAQLYRRENGEKRICAIEGSRPKDCFFRKELLKGHKRLIIAKSPREAMLYYQEMGNTYDVISISSGEVTYFELTSSGSYQRVIERADYKTPKEFTLNGA